MGFGYILAQMLALCVPIAAGFIARKLDFMSDETANAISRIVLNITLPCLLVASIGSANGVPDKGTVLLMIAYGCAGYLISIAIAFAVPALMRAPRAEAGAYRFLITFGNVGFIGYPVLSSIYGSEALLYAAIANIPFNLFMYSLGIAMVRRSAAVQKAERIAAGGSEAGPDGLDVSQDPERRLPLRRRVHNMLVDVANPTFIASLVLLALVLLGVDDLGVLGSGLTLVGNFTTPAALLVIGATLAQYKPLQMLTNWRAYVASACRLLVVPLAVLVVCGGFVTDDFVHGILVVGFAMPAASNGVLFSLLYGADVKPMMQGTFITIVASIVTIPLVALLV